MFQKKNNFKSTESNLQDWLSSCVQVAWFGIERPLHQFNLQATPRNEDLTPHRDVFGSPNAISGSTLAEDPQSGYALCGCENCHIKSSNFFNHFPFRVSIPLTVIVKH